MAETRVIDQPSGGLSGLLKAALPSVPLLNQLPGVRKNSGEFTGLTFTRPGVRIDADHVARYARVCDFPAKDTAPLTYPHLLAFGLHMGIMTSPEFPYPAIGTVHLSNSVTAHRHLHAGEEVDVTVACEPPRPHLKGATVDFLTKVRVGDDLVWESTSTYLRRGVTASGSEPRPDDRLKEIPSGTVQWRLPSDLGRQYAAVSGDHNPIHLYSLTAKALGFPRQIAHGMWSMARCVSAIENRLPEAVTVEVAFKKPILLPGTVAFGLNSDDAGHAFALTKPKDGSPHLIGRAYAAS